jgi:prophage regulatory protein
MTLSSSARHRLIRCPEVCNRLGLPKSSLYEAINNELMTPGVKITDRSVGWPEHEVDAVLVAAISYQQKL